MAWCAARCMNLPAVDVGSLRPKAPAAAAGVGFVSLSGSNLCRSSSRSKPFACCAISTEANLKRAVTAEDSNLNDAEKNIPSVIDREGYILSYFWSEIKRESSKNKDVTTDYRDLWIQCEECYGLNYKKFLKSKMYVCEHCGEHLKMSSSDRIELLIDQGNWNPMVEDMVATDPIEFDAEGEFHSDNESEASAALGTRGSN